MEPINQSQLFSLLEGMGREQTSFNPGSQSVSQMIPFSSWDALSNPSIFEGKTIEQIQDFRMGIVTLKAAFPHILQRVQPLIEMTDDAVRESNPDLVSRAETSHGNAPSVISPPSEKGETSNRTAHIQAHVNRQMEKANAYAAYQGKAFIPEIEPETNRLVKKEEYLKTPAKILSGEAFEMTLNYHLVEPEVAERVAGAHERARQQGLVIEHDSETALIRSATFFDERNFELLSSALMVDPK